MWLCVKTCQNPGTLPPENSWVNGPSFPPPHMEFYGFCRCFRSISQLLGTEKFGVPATSGPFTGTWLTQKTFADEDPPCFDLSQVYMTSYSYIYIYNINIKYDIMPVIIQYCIWYHIIGRELSGIGHYSAIQDLIYRKIWYHAINHEKSCMDSMNMKINWMIYWMTWGFP